MTIDREVEFEVFLSNVIKSIYNLEKIECERLANKNISRIWKDFKKQLQKDKRNKIFPYYKIINDDLKIIRPTHAPLDDDNSKDIQLKNKMKKRGRILEYIESLNDREYEALGCIICDCCDAKNTFLTPPKNEFGIDFISIIPCSSRYHLFPNIDKQIMIIGQSKKWSSNVKRDSVDLLISSMNRIFQRSSYIMKILPKWIYEDNRLCLGLIIANESYQSGAIDIANDYGITLADNRDLAEIITNHFNENISSEGIIDELNLKIANYIIM